MVGAIGIMPRIAAEAVSVGHEVARNVTSSKDYGIGG